MHDVDGRPHDTYTPVTVSGQTFRCCGGCAERQGWATEQMVMRGLSVLAPTSYVAFLTVTEPTVPRSFAEHSASVGAFLRDLFRLLDRAAGVPAGSRRHEYLGVREIQPKRLAERGEVAWHTHLLVTNWSRIDLREGSDFRALLAKHGLGTVGGNVKAWRAGVLLAQGGRAKYLSKSLGAYLGKSGRVVQAHALHETHLPKHARLIVHSVGRGGRGGWADGLTFGRLHAESLAAWRAKHGLPTAEEVASDPAWLTCMCSLCLERPPRLSYGLEADVDDLDAPLQLALGPP